MSPKKSWPIDDDSDPDVEGPAEPPPGYGPTGWPPKPAPNRRPISGWWKFAGGVGVLALIPVVIWYLNQKLDPRASARGTADLISKAVIDGNVSAFDSYGCDEGVAALWPGAGGATVLAVSDERGGKATVSLELAKVGGEEIVELPMARKNGQWCLGLFTP